MSSRNIRNIIYDIETSHSIHLSDYARQKVAEGVKGAIQKDRESQEFTNDMYERLYKELNEGQYLKQRNELVIRLNREINSQPQHAEVFSYVLFIMNDIEQKLKEGKSVRAKGRMLK